VVNEREAMNETHTVQIKQNELSFILVLLSLISIMIMFTEAMLIPALPTLQVEFNTTATWASWILSIYLIAGAVSTPIFGKLGDTYGKKRLLVICLSLYTLGVIANGFAWNIQSLLAFRALQGLGMGIFPLAYALIRDEFPPEKVAMSTGIISAMFGVGTAIGLVVGAWITENFGWRMTYHAVVPLAIGVTLLAFYKLQESPIRNPSKVDVIGATTFSVAILTFLVAMTEGERWGWTSVATLGLIAVSFVFIALFVLVERRVRDPMIDLGVLSKRNVFFTNISAFVVGLGMFMMFQSITYLVRMPAPVGFGSNIFDAGLIQVPGSILGIVVGPLAGRLVSKRGAKLPLVIGSIVLSISFYFIYAFHYTQAQVVFGLIVMSAGMGLMMVSMINIVIQSVSQFETGIATAMNTIFRTIGGVIGPTIAGVFLARYVSPLVIQTPRGSVVGPLIPNATAFNYIFLTALGVSLVGVLVTLLIKGKGTEIERRRPVEEAAPEV
jgi:EmrB/QacA subfamily drug resistance transporter